MKIARIPLLAFALLTCAYAELPPSVYEAKQKSAPEQIEILILRVNIEPGQNESQKIEVLARVQSIIRSTAKLKPQDMITIEYTVNHHPSGWVGPGEVPIPERGKTTVAYLDPISKSRSFSPAAGRMSFSKF